MNFSVRAIWGSMLETTKIPTTTLQALQINAFNGAAYF
jgi:hypothetical protein